MRLSLAVLNRKRGEERTMQKEAECPCPHTDCERHGDCVACFMYHDSQEQFTYCLSQQGTAISSLRDRVIDRLQTARIPMLGHIT